MQDLKTLKTSPEQIDSSLSTYLSYACPLLPLLEGSPGTSDIKEAAALAAALPDVPGKGQVPPHQQPTNEMDVSGMGGSTSRPPHAAGAAGGPDQMTSGDAFLGLVRVC